MGFVSREFRIFRKTLPSDTFGSVGSANRLTFNGNGRDNNVANGWTTGFRIGTPRDIAKHDNPNENLSEQQDAGLDESVTEIKGIISRADLISNVFMNNLVDWNESEEGQESTDLPSGRFAFDIDRAPRLSQESNATTGMEIRSLTWEFRENEPNEMDFTLILSRGKESA